MRGCKVKELRRALRAQNVAIENVRYGVDRKGRLSAGLGRRLYQRMKRSMRAAA